MLSQRPGAFSSYFHHIFIIFSSDLASGALQKSPKELSFRQRNEVRRAVMVGLVARRASSMTWRGRAWCPLAPSSPKPAERSRGARAVGAPSEVRFEGLRDGGGLQRPLHPPGSQRPLPCASGKFGSTTAAWRYLDVHASGKLGARVDESHRNAHSSRDAQLNSRHLRIVMDGVGWLTVAPRLESMCANVRRHGCSG